MDGDGFSDWREFCLLDIQPVNAIRKMGNVQVPLLVGYQLGAVLIRLAQEPDRSLYATARRVSYV